MHGFRYVGQSCGTKKLTMEHTTRDKGMFSELESLLHTPATPKVSHPALHYRESKKATNGVLPTTVTKCVTSAPILLPLPQRLHLSCPSFSLYTLSHRTVTNVVSCPPHCTRFVTTQVATVLNCHATVRGLHISAQIVLIQGIPES